METTRKVKQFKYFDNYRVTHHIGPELIEIEVLEKINKWWYLEPKYEWKRIYCGFSTPIQHSLEFFNESKAEEDRIKEVLKQKQEQEI